jgi:hypothetical protein
LLLINFALLNICGEFFTGIAFHGFLLTSKIVKIKTQQKLILLQYLIDANPLYNKTVEKCQVNNISGTPELDINYSM